MPFVHVLGVYIKILDGEVKLNFVDEYAFHLQCPGTIKLDRLAETFRFLVQKKSRFEKGKRLSDDERIFSFIKHGHEGMDVQIYNGVWDFALCILKLVAPHYTL